MIFKAKEGDKIRLLTNEKSRETCYEKGDIVIALVEGMDSYIRASKNGIEGYNKNDYVLLREDQYEVVEVTKVKLFNLEDIRNYYFTVNSQYEVNETLDILENLGETIATKNLTYNKDWNKVGYVDYQGWKLQQYSFLEKHTFEELKSLDKCSSKIDSKSLKVGDYVKAIREYNDYIIEGYFYKVIEIGPPGCFTVKCNIKTGNINKNNNLYCDGTDFILATEEEYNKQAEPIINKEPLLSNIILSGFPRISNTEINNLIKDLQGIYKKDVVIKDCVHGNKSTIEKEEYTYYSEGTVYVRVINTEENNNAKTQRIYDSNYIKYAEVITTKSDTMKPKFNMYYHVPYEKMEAVKDWLISLGSSFGISSIESNHNYLWIATTNFDKFHFGNAYDATTNTLYHPFGELIELGFKDTTNKLVIDTPEEQVIKEEFKVGDYVMIKSLRREGVTYKTILNKVFQISQVILDYSGGNDTYVKGYGESYPHLFSVDNGVFTSDIKKATENEINEYNLEKAKRLYPEGTLIKSLYGNDARGKEEKVRGVLQIHNNNRDISTIHLSGFLFYDGQWAEIINTPTSDQRLMEAGTLIPNVYYDHQYPYRIGIDSFDMDVKSIYPQPIVDLDIKLSNKQINTSIPYIPTIKTEIKQKQKHFYF